MDQITPFPPGTPLVQGPATAPVQRWLSTLVRTVNLLITGTREGYGDPNGVETGTVGDTYRRKDGGAGTSFYVKESGAHTATGWVGK